MWSRHLEALLLRGRREQINIPSSLCSEASGDFVVLIQVGLYLLWVWVGLGDLESPFRAQLLNDSASRCCFPLFLLMALLCFPQCHQSGCLPMRKHLKSPFILLIGFSALENAFPGLMKSVLQDPLAAGLGARAMYAVQMNCLGAGEGVSSSRACSAACWGAAQVLLACMTICVCFCCRLARQSRLQRYISCKTKRKCSLRWRRRQPLRRNSASSSPR